MKTQYYTATSLDGFIADVDHSLDWLFQFGDSPGEDYDAFIASVGAIAMGSSTYEWLLKHDVLAAPDNPKPWPYTQPTWVFTSRDLPVIRNADIRFVRGDVRPVHDVMEAAAGEKNIWIVGGGDLVGQFHDHGLLDEIIATIAPVTLGSGAQLLPRRITTPPLRLLSVQPYGGVYAQLKYEVVRTRM